MCLEDLECVLDAQNLPQTIYLPKVESNDELTWFYTQVDKLLKVREDYSLGKLRLIIFCESGNSLLSFKEICDHAKSMEALTIDGAVFGSDDFCADLGISRTSEGAELLYARQRFVTVVKSRRLQAIDAV